MGPHLGTDGLRSATGTMPVDATWGTIRPIRLAPDVRTVGELEVLAHIERGLPLIDSRLPHYYRAGTIPTAASIPHTDTTARLSELRTDIDTVLFCNGAQCAATPDAIEQLLNARFPPERILYYRGGMHDWLTLGLPTAPPNNNTS